MYDSFLQAIKHQVTIQIPHRQHDHLIPEYSGIKKSIFWNQVVVLPVGDLPVGDEGVVLPVGD